MKKIIVLITLCVLVTGFAAAGGLVFQLGAGYHSSFGTFSDAPSSVDDVKAMPLGVGGYAGLGYGFGDKKMLSLGAEFAPSWDLCLNPMGVSNFNYQLRAFAKLKPAGLLTLTGYAGYAGEIFLGGDIDDYKANSNLALGARLTLLFLYAEYDVVMPWDFSGINKHEVGLGFALFK